MKATTDDWKEISEIAYESWAVAYANILSQNQIDFMLKSSYSEKGIFDAIYSGQEFYFIRFKENSVSLGFIALMPGENIMRIEKLYLRPDSQGLGLGKKFIDFAESIACTNRLNILELNVNRNNKAYFFYLRQGFEVFKSIDIPYHEFVLNDFIMRKKISL
ncbi:GNAT family N-acetyltransferase [Sphingobacterium sp. UT-1RO-CII-1]|uniref:GNAT family N-acetyltransferase n=1 Tax=Sphingobacterium sp. UT-1RO-CII-1 TaxID=2995225 RepID=UPI00227B4252|nr:GNAT family N-acetyltransferase [Sphingobacterium sp. UT-1RO-CII-1]MCY4778695.1 GNAT family N-acetyltransferase [Sphingobacterium sp. UT-1RO-CII-1]